MKKILFVCMGNICRSPLAEGIAREIVKNRGLDYEIDSAGLSSYHSGEAPCENSQIVAENNGIDLSAQRSRPFSMNDVTYYDYIVGMDSSNIDGLKYFRVKTPLKLGDYGCDGEDVPDPYLYRGFSGFEKIYEMIDIGVNNLLTDIAKLGDKN